MYTCLRRQERIWSFYLLFYLKIIVKVMQRKTKGRRAISESREKKAKDGYKTNLTHTYDRI